jgi:hypothetical protein
MSEIQEDMVKGRIAEDFVKCMFEDLGFEVIPYGYEHTCPTIANPKSLIKGEVSELIRKTPDFIIVDKNKNATFIEVKFRGDGIFKKELDYPYNDAYIILLTRDYIGIEKYKNLDPETKLDGKVFAAMKNNLQKNFKGSFKSFKDVPLFKDCNFETVKKYRLLLIKYMNN